MFLKFKKSTFFAAVVGSCFMYTSQIMLSPIYAAFLCLFTIMISLLLVRRGAISVDFNFAFSMIGLVYSLIIYDRVTDFGTYINFLMCLILILLYPLYFGRMNKSVFECKAINYMAISVLSLYLFECIYRLKNPIYTDAMLMNPDENLFFYPYKYNSIMFIDSNFVGLSLLSFIVVIDTLFKGSNKKSLFLFFSFLLLTLTFSRAALISVFIYFLFKRLNFKGLLILIFTIAGFVFTLLPSMLIDGSFLSKFKILNYFNNYISNVDFFTLLCGSGIGTSLSVLGIGSHNLLVLLTVEFGLIALIGFISFVIFNIFQTSFKSTPYWLSVLTCGFSLGSLYAFIFIPALLLVTKLKEDEFNNVN